MSRYLVFVFVLCAACRLEPLVDDEPGASLEILPPGSTLPHIDDNLELLHQIQVHDGLDDGALEENGGRVLRITGWADGAEVSYWSFGNAPKFGALAYVLVEHDGRLVEHPMILDSIPGDSVYSPMRKLIHVEVTDEYDGEVFPTVESLTDGVELGLVLEPSPVGTWFDAPIVMPGTTLDRGEGVEPTPARTAIVQGYTVDVFVFDDDPRAVQPLRSGSIPTTQAASLREQGSVSFKPSPVFQRALPAAPPSESSNYTPLVQIVEVQLAGGVVAADLHADADLFTRSMSGSINGYTAAVDSATVTTVYKNWPMELSPLEVE